MVAFKILVFFCIVERRITEKEYLSKSEIISVEDIFVKILEVVPECHSFI